MILSNPSLTAAFNVGATVSKHLINRFFSYSLPFISVTLTYTVQFSVISSAISSVISTQLPLAPIFACTVSILNLLSPKIFVTFTSTMALSLYHPGLSSAIEIRTLYLLSFDVTSSVVASEALVSFFDGVSFGASVVAFSLVVFCSVVTSVVSVLSSVFA